MHEEVGLLGRWVTDLIDVFDHLGQLNSDVGGVDDIPARWFVGSDCVQLHVGDCTQEDDFKGSPENRVGDGVVHPTLVEEVQGPHWSKPSSARHGLEDSPGDSGVCLLCVRQSWEFSTLAFQSVFREERALGLDEHTHFPGVGVLLHHVVILDFPRDSFHLRQTGLDPKAEPGEEMVVAFREVARPVVDQSLNLYISILLDCLITRMIRTHLVFITTLCSLDPLTPLDIYPSLVN